MKLIRIIICVIFMNGYLLSNEKADINLQNMPIMDLVEITSKIMNKNILYTQKVIGHIDYISNKPVNSDELYKILIHVLKEKGFTIVEDGDILKIIQLKDSSKSNVPISSTKSDSSYFMVSEVVNVANIDVDILAAKVRYLLSKDGKLMTNKPTNNFIITDFKENVETIKTIITLVLKNSQRSMEIIELNHIRSADAKINLDLIAKSMHDEKVQTQKIDIIDNSVNNSIVVIGKSTNIKYLKKYILELDKDSSLITRKVEAFFLKNIEATNILKIIEEIIGKKTYAKPENKPFFSVDSESNSIVVMGLSSEIEYVSELIKKLDIEKAQVYVQARIIEINNELVDRIGISYGLFGGTGGSKGLSTFSTSLNGASDTLLSGQITAATTTMGLTIPNLSSALALGASLNLLKQNGALTIVSEPSILAVNNSESSIYVGETISIKSASTLNSSGIPTDSYTREDVGLTLKVKPRISNDNKVTLDINTILEGVKTTETTSGNADTTKKEINTTAILNNGESVIIGGLIQDKTESTNQKVPFLGDIPLFGELFKNKSEDYTKNNLVVIITPYLIPKAKDITYVRNKLSKLKQLEDDYLEDALFRLKKEEIKRKIKLKEKQKEQENLDNQLKKLDNKEEKEILSEHQKRVNAILSGGSYSEN